MFKPEPARMVTMSKATQLQALDDEYKRGLQDGLMNAIDLLCGYCAYGSPLEMIPNSIADWYAHPLKDKLGSYQACGASDLRKAIKRNEEKAK